MHRLLAVLLLLAPASPALANCAEPVSYETRVVGPQVTVCLTNFDNRRCPDQGLLRRGAGGTVVKLTTCDAQGCFVDECVGPGPYQYGLAVPYQCVPVACSTDYFANVTVAAAGGECTRTMAEPEPAPAVPWKNERHVCTHGGSSWGCTGLIAGIVFPVQGAVMLAGLAIMAVQRRRR